MRTRVLKWIRRLFQGMPEKERATRIEYHLRMIRDIGTHCADEGQYREAKHAIKALVSVQEIYQKDKDELPPEWFEAGGSEDFVEDMIHEFMIEIQDAIEARKKYFIKKKPWKETDA